MIRSRRERPVNVTPFIHLLEEDVLLSENEAMAWYEENSPDSSLNAALYYAAKKHGPGNPKTAPLV